MSGLHRVERGAEIAFIEVARNLAHMGEDVTLVGSGPDNPDTAYKYIRLKSGQRERFERLPSLPFFRDETAWEDVASAVQRAFVTDEAGSSALVERASDFAWANVAKRYREFFREVVAA